MADRDNCAVSLVRMSSWPELAQASTEGKAVLAYQDDSVAGPIVSKRDTSGTDLGLQGSLWVNKEQD